MTQKEYYTAPPKKVFNEIKKASIEIWKTYNDEFGYATGEINRIKDIENISDNAWYMVAMFDYGNQAKLLGKVSGPTGVMILDAMES